jgi:hypothetical protein
VSEYFILNTNQASPLVHGLLRRQTQSCHAQLGGFHLDLRHKLHHATTVAVLRHTPCVISMQWRCPSFTALNTAHGTALQGVCGTPLQ